MSIESSFPIYYQQCINKKNITLPAPKVIQRTFPLQSNVTYSELKTNNTDSIIQATTGVYIVNRDIFGGKRTLINPGEQYYELSNTSISFTPTDYNYWWYKINMPQPFQTGNSCQIKIFTDVLNYHI